MKVEQVVWEPASGKYIPDETALPQLKYDGSQYHLHLMNGKAFALTSRRISKKTGKLSEKINNFPQIKGKKLFDIKGYSIFVSEVVAEHLKDLFDSKKILDKKGKPFNWSKRSNYVASVMNSDPARMKPHNLKLVVHDILKLSDEDITEDAYIERWRIVKNKINTPAGVFGENLSNKNIVYHVSNMDADASKPKKLLKRILKVHDVEGIVIKDRHSSLMKKVKREREADCIIIGYKKGNGKYKDQVGSLIVGALKKTDTIKTNANEITAREVKLLIKNDLVKEVGRISGFDDSIRKIISNNKERTLGRVVHCEYMQWTGKKMRHPRIGVHGIRKDKLVRRCTMGQFSN